MTTQDALALAQEHGYNPKGEGGTAVEHLVLYVYGELANYLALNTFREEETTPAKRVALGNLALSVLDIEATLCKIGLRFTKDTPDHRHPLYEVVSTLGNLAKLTLFWNALGRADKDTLEAFHVSLMLVWCWMHREAVTHGTTLEKAVGESLDNLKQHKEREAAMRPKMRKVGVVGKEDPGDFIREMVQKAFGEDVQVTVQTYEVGRGEGMISPEDVLRHIGFTGKGGEA